MKTYRCDGIVPDCHVTFAGSEEQIEQMSVQHAQRDHGMTQISAEQLAQIRANIS